MTLNEYVNQIVIELKVRMEQSELFPFDDGTRYKGQRKRPQFKPHAKNVALKNNYITVVSPDIQMFEIGNEYAERTAPHYHILEDAQKISNPGRSTKKTRGSQGLIANKAKRDYSVEINIPNTSKVTQEYRQSFKEGRRNYQKAQMLLSNKNYESRNEGKPFRYNQHYAYIERILEKETPLIASALGIRLDSRFGLNVAPTAISEVVGDSFDNTLGFFEGLGI